MKAKERRDIDLILKLIRSMGGVCHLKNKEMAKRLSLTPRTMRLDDMLSEVVHINKK